jgi:hypothetical protein
LLSRLATSYQTCKLDPTRFDCHCEITCDDNVITSYNLTTYTPFNYSGYRNCNPTPHSTLLNYSYDCDGSYYPDVGVDQVKTYAWFAKKGIPNYLPIWKHKLGAQLGGTWYATMAASECKQLQEGQHHHQERQSCVWAAKEIKVLDKSCMVARFTEATFVADPLCFSGCPNAPYSNSSAFVEDACWAECFVDTIFQIDADTLERIWVAAFASENPALGGCPAQA